MKSGVVLFVLGILAAGIIFLSLQIFGKNDSEAQYLQRLETIEGDLGDLKAELSRLGGELQSLHEQMGAVNSSGGRLSQQDIDDSVDRWMQSHDAGRNGTISAASANQSSHEAIQDSESFDLQAAILKLSGEELSESEYRSFWGEIVKAGKIDEAVAEFERRANANPNDSDAQVQLGHAYLQKLFTVGDMEKGAWSVKSDKAFSAALEVDPQHWDARFSKAVSLSFWPAIFGKKDEAIHHFEILLEQQEAKNSEKKFAQSYLYLGNLYQEKGDKDKAKAIWERGLSRFPTNSALQSKMSEGSAK